jgi:sulfite exporter TauE/SafE/copper chaperone CopZ
MTCVACQERVGRALKQTPGVRSARVSYNRASATVTYDPQQTNPQLIARAIEAAGYEAVDAAAEGSADSTSNKADLVGLLFVVVALFLFVQHFGLTRLFTATPLASEGMGYGALFVVGLITSVHCIGMCGGISLSTSLSAARSATAAATTVGTPAPATRPRTRRASTVRRASILSSRTRHALLPSLLYNAGRVISYTLVGAVVGALGGVISFDGAAKGIVQLLAGIFMVIMGLNMLGAFPILRWLTPRLPRFFAQAKAKAQSSSRLGRLGAARPFIVGLLNGLMPCGPLQAMQLYALSTSSPVKGALSMLVFSLGTVPLMFGLGALSSLLTKRFTRAVMTTGAVIVITLGLVMGTTGASLSGLRLPAFLGGGSTANAQTATVEGDVQVVSTTLAGGAYEPITVRAGIPVRWTISARDADINGCNNAIIIPEYNLEYEFHPGDNLIEFTPTRPGTFIYTCWMGMISSTITVLDESGQQVEGSIDETQNYPAFSGGGAGAGAGCACCAGAAPQ